MKRRIVALLLCLLAVFGPSVGAGERLTGAESLASGIVDFKAAQSGAADAASWVASVLPQTMGKGGEWYAIALSQRGGCDLSACRAALLDYTANTTVRSATTRQKLALALLATGGPTNFVKQTLSDAIGKQGVMSWAWGLHLLNNGCESPLYNKEAILHELLALRKEDGGWAITGGVSDADATAMVLQALAPHRQDAEVAAAIGGALTLLSARQLASGGFASYGVENAESAAQVIIALCALEIAPRTDGRFLKNGLSPVDALTAFCLADGSFAHEIGGAYNESATAQAFLALTALERRQNGEGPLYLLDGDVQPGEMMTALSWKTVAMLAIGGAALLACLVLALLGKRHPKNFLAAVLIAAALAGVVSMVDVQSAADYYSVAVRKDDAVGTVTLTIRCDKVAGQAAHIPAEGVILAETTLPIAEGDTVYTVLTDAARAHGFHMEASGADGLMYIHGIGNIYEFDFGELSGWVYMVNGAGASVGCDQYVLRDGDRVEMHYTLELGKDIYP